MIQDSPKNSSAYMQSCPTCVQSLMQVVSSLAEQTNFENLFVFIAPSSICWDLEIGWISDFERFFLLFRFCGKNTKQ
jgi:hypothetical protein